MAPDRPAEGRNQGRGLEELYSEAILDHARNPRREAALDDPDASGDAVNPFCGDEAHVQISFSNGRIAGLGMQTVGCSINRASGSMIAEALNGASPGDAEALAADYRALMTGSESNHEEREKLGDLALMVGVRKFPVRIKCAMLALTALEEALADVSR